MRAAFILRFPLKNNSADLVSCRRISGVIKLNGGHDIRCRVRLCSSLVTHCWSAKPLPACPLRQICGHVLLDGSTDLREAPLELIARWQQPHPAPAMAAGSGDRQGWEGTLVDQGGGLCTIATKQSVSAAATA
ncbi:hypothetical protein P7K49_031384 [Saguinus oedipus]|uniref:Uncharacterized protein n=1 Tax=Saguinus oedipus TaxID=9490 RepID=A0ABQ9U0E7_SAGOE|nr:hypothetical protein P7K49_031384 [Saguinus oedipus]